MFHDKCGVIGIWNSTSASHLAYAGLYALQHRGQEGAGIAVSDGKRISAHKGMGKVMDIFDEATLRDRLQGPHAIGHTRYSTSGGSFLENVQPLQARMVDGQVAVAHNGQITNAFKLRDELEGGGSLFQTYSDTEILLHLMAQLSQQPFEDRLLNALVKLQGAFSLVLLYRDQLIGIRDPDGFRPLCLGKKDDSYILASETCALDLLEADFVREIEPGEVIFIDSGGLRSEFPFRQKPNPHFCVFELIYFSRPDSHYQNRSVHEIRKCLGHQLAAEGPCPDAEVVMSVPDSSNAAALGYAEATGLPFELGMIRNHYIGRTFIEPTQNIRDWRARIKYNPIRSVIEDKKIVLVDDSIVRGTTAKRIVRLLKDAGAKEIHIRVSSPIIFHPCYYGIDTPDYDELIGHQKQTEEAILDHLQADTLHYLSLDGLEKVMTEHGNMKSYCDACFSGNYPVPIVDTEADKPENLPLFPTTSEPKFEV